MASPSTSKTMVLIQINCLFFFLLIADACHDLTSNIISTDTSNKLMEFNMTSQILTSQNEDCEVQISFNIVNGLKAECSISIKNLTNNNLYFFNRIYFDTTNEGLFIVNRNNFYSYLSDEKLFLAKAIIPLPPGLKVEKKIFPCCTKIKAGELFEEDLEIELPIKLYAPYTKKPANISKQYPVVVRLGYFMGYEQTESMEIILHSDEGDVIYFDPFDYNYQKIIEIGIFNPLPIAQ